MAKLKDMRVNMAVSKDTNQAMRMNTLLSAIEARAQAWQAMPVGPVTPAPTLSNVPAQQNMAHSPSDPPTAIARPADSKASPIAIIPPRTARYGDEPDMAKSRANPGPQPDMADSQTPTQSREPAWLSAWYTKLKAMLSPAISQSKAGLDYEKDTPPTAIARQANSQASPIAIDSQAHSPLSPTAHYRQAHSLVSPTAHYSDEPYTSLSHSSPMPTAMPAPADTQVMAYVQALDAKLDAVLSQLSAIHNTLSAMDSPTHSQDSQPIMDISKYRQA